MPRNMNTVRKNAAEIRRALPKPRENLTDSGGRLAGRSLRLH